MTARSTRAIDGMTLSELERLALCIERFHQAVLLRIKHLAAKADA